MQCISMNLFWAILLKLIGSPPIYQDSFLYTQLNGELVVTGSTYGK